MCIRDRGNSPKSLGKTMGYRILRVPEGTPEEEAGLRPFLDFIVDATVGEASPSAEPASILDVLNGSREDESILKVYSILSRTIREVRIPKKAANSIDSPTARLLFRAENYESALDNSLKIISVQDGSPAAVAKLSVDDFLLGMVEYAYADLNDFVRFINKSSAQQVELGVYSSTTKQVRLVKVNPNNKWGGKGYLGCEFATGLLNRLPVDKETEESFEGESITEAIKHTEETAPKPQPIEAPPVVERTPKSTTNHKSVTRTKSETGKSIKPPPFSHSQSKNAYKKEAKRRKSSLGEDFEEVRFRGVQRVWIGNSKPIQEPGSEGSYEVLSSRILSRRPSVGSLDNMLASPSRKDEEVAVPTFETTRIYTFHSAKLKGNYIIKSSDLFDLSIDISSFGRPFLGFAIN
eukprot:TRINITY_DN8490_c0_g1_i1.p1 TRINITY_DN8490_c0_g1~~TRINITY_DN8490_c0_g1_i1.p1  ORF type:complete len:423 (-),score=76.46 TRINITY_DN8490_c0_g1_i1:106-1326(-)